MIKEILIKRAFPGKEPAGPLASRLSFHLDGVPGGEEAKEMGTVVRRSILKTGNSFHYAIGDSGIGGADRKIMEEAKAAVIGVLSAETVEIGLSLFDRAKEMAYMEMLRKVDQERARYLSYFVAHDTVGSGPFSILMEDRGGIEEIEVNSALAPITVYTVSHGRCPTNIRFADENAFRQCLNKFISENEKELSEESPIIDAQVADARIHAQIRPYALSGAAASIRIGKSKAMGVFGLLKGRTLSVEALAYVWLALDSGVNMVISGAPASGKTTMLGAIASLIPHYSKLVTVEEEINELRFSEPVFNVVSLYGSKYGATNTRAQVINALRMRPDRIIVGEIRGEEARELFAGANLGIPFITTMHSGEDGLSVIKKLMIRPMAVEPRALSMLDVCIYMKQNGIRERCVSSISEYRWLSRAETERGVETGDGDSVESSVVARDGATTEEAVSSSKAFLRYSSANGLSSRAAARELGRRIAFLRSSFESSRSDEQMGESISRYRRGAVS